MKKKLPGWAVLLIITLAAGLALGGTYALTKDPIAEQARAAAENARKAALPDADAFEALAVADGAAVDWVYAGLKDGAAVGYVAQKTVNGFGGKVEVIAGVNTQDAPSFTIGGVSVGGSDFSETAGLGARAKEPAFTSQFAGKTAPISFIKAGGEKTDSTVDALTSATITTTAVVNGVNDIVKYVKSDVLGIVGVEMPALPAGAQTYSSSAQGFRGPVYVEAAFEGSTIVYLSVGDESFAEDIGVGVKDADFMYQFIGKTAPVDIADVDAIAGATISSKAVVKALNEAFTLASGGEIIVPETPVMPELAQGAQAYSATEQGFRGPVYVEAAFDENGAVAYMKVGDEAFAEDIGAGVKEPDFMYQFIGKTAPVDIADVDTIAGATISSTAVVNALNKAYNLSQGIEEEPAPEITLPEKPAEGVSSASAQGFGGPVAVEAAFDADGRITYISIGDDQFAETPGLGARALEPEFQAQFIGKQMPIALTDIDALTGATVTSTAVVDALNEAFSPSETKEEPAAAVLPEKPAEGVSSASAQGFGGPVAVEAAFDADGRITYISIGDDQFAETPGLGARALEPEFQAQFIGKQMPIALTDIDALTGATVTSTAVVDALNEAYQPQGQEETKAQPEETQAPTAEPTPAATEAPLPEATAAPVAEPTPAPAADQKAQDVRVTAIRKAEDGIVTVDAISFFTQIEAKVNFVEGSVVVLSVADKPAGSVQALTPSARESELRALFFNASLPLDVAGQKTPYAVALASAINRAYEVYGAVETAAKPVGIGEYSIQQSEKGVVTVEAISFFTQIEAKVLFVGNKVRVLSVSDKPAGSVQAAAPSAQEKELKEMLDNAALPLDIAGQKTPYAVALASAVNQAYAAFGSKEVPAEPVKLVSEAKAPVLYVAATFESGTLKSLFVKEKNAQGEFVASDTEKELQEKYVGQALPLQYQADSLYEALVAVSVNSAFAEAEQAAPSTEAEIEAQPVQQEPEAAQPEAEGGLTSDAISFFTAIEVKASFDGNVLTALTVYEKPVNGEQYGLSGRDEEMKALFVGAEMPLNTAQQSAFASAVAAAVNQVYTAPEAEAAPQEIEEIRPVAEEETPAPEAVQPEIKEPQPEAEEPQPETEDGLTGGAISFFTAIEVKVSFDGNVLTALTVYEKPVNGEQYGLSGRDEEMKALFVGAEMPLNTAQQSAFASAVAAAVNQAYTETETACCEAETVRTDVGSCICFFTDYIVYAEFGGDALLGFSLFENRVGENEMIHDDSSALYAALAGRAMPLDAGSLPLTGEAPYVTQAVVIALNLAYEDSLSGQQ